MIIDGEKISREREKILAEKVKQLKERLIEPCLAVLVFSGDSAGQLYCRLKAEAAARLGIRFIKSETNLIEEWNHDPAIHGIMVQRPGYKGEKFEKEWTQLVKTIVPSKDVDGLRDDSLFTQATVKAVENIPFRNGMTIRNGMKGKKVLIVGRGMVGRKLSQRLRAENVSSHQADLADKTRGADILISCCGREKIIKAPMVKPGAVVIDVGWPKGDVDFNSVKRVAGAITPVPGGVGPVTVICLLENLVKAVYNQAL